MPITMNPYLRKLSLLIKNARATPIKQLSKSVNDKSLRGSDRTSESIRIFDNILEKMNKEAVKKSPNDKLRVNTVLTNWGEGFFLCINVDPKPASERLVRITVNEVATAYKPNSSVERSLDKAEK